MRSFVWLTIVLAGCGASRFRTEHVGVAQVGGDTSIPLGRGNYQMTMRFDVPRAQVVAWTLQCPGIERTGVAGETFENYRTRRLAELQRMVEQDRRNLATVTNAIAGQAGAAVQVRAPNATVHAEAQAPSGEVVAEQAIQQIHELPIGDVGAGTYNANLSIQTFEDGACTVTTQALDPIRGSIAIDRVRDLEAEKQERVASQRANAFDARLRVRARLVASGADEQARARRLAEQARLREEEIQRRKELEVKAAAEREARREAERVARIKHDEENRLRLEAEARLRWEAEAPERARLALLEREQAEKRRIREAEEANLRQERLAFEENERREKLVIIERERREKIIIIERERRERLLIIERQRTAALTVRGAYIAWLVGTCNADPHRYARIQQERIDRERRIEIETYERERRIEIERVERERRITIERERRMQADREREAQLQAERERIDRERQARAQRELETAFAVRAQLSGYLVGAGARMRPPRPTAIVEVAGSAPFDGARWESGTWMWSHESWQWQWRKGGWVDSVQFGAAGGETIVRAPTTVVREAPVQTTTTSTTSTATVDVSVPSGVTIGVPQGSISIDVAPVAPRGPKPTARDHRRRVTTEEPPPARVRDHRRR